MSSIFYPDSSKSHFENGIALAMEMGFDNELDFDSFVAAYEAQAIIDEQEYNLRCEQTLVSFQ